MRKFLVSLALVVVAAAVVFYFGWVQLQLPADTYGVVFTKTAGWDATVLRPGTFVWRWERLIPTNFTLFKYTLTPQQEDLQANGTLPSGDVYSQYLPGNPDFSYTIDVAVSYRINPNRLPSLTAKGVITPKTLLDWYKGFDSTLLQKIQSELPNIVHRLSSANADFSFVEIGSALKKELSVQFPEVTILTVTPRTIKYPDIGLYNRAKQVYDGLLQSKTQAIETATRLAAPAQVQKDSRIEMLKQYGQLLTQYPILLKYLALEAGQNPDSIKLGDSNGSTTQQ